MKLGWTVVALLAVITRSSLAAYPVFGTKRFGRSWTPLPLYPSRASRPAYPAYYDPYAQDFGELLDFYYPIDPYDKYRLYQMPYYYPELPPYAYYGLEESGDLTEDVQDDTLQDDREGEVPYGQETWYDSGPRKQIDANAEANAVFLQNLILAQMYKDAAAKGYRYPAIYSYPRDDYDEGYVYGEPVADPTEAAVKEDEDVRELKSLSEARKGHKAERERTEHENIFAEQKAARRRSWYPNNQWSDQMSKRSGETTTAAPRDKGQDEVVLPRPAPPPRQPSFHQHTRSREPSVYDSIKKLLHMQDELEQQGESSGSRPQKRSYIPSEESLVEQLGNLKKSA